MLKTRLYQNQKLLFKRYHSESDKEAIHWEKTLANYISDKRLVFQSMLKNTKKFNNKKTNNTIFF